MNNLSTGDTVRFLNTVGGGVVKGFPNRHTVIVEDEYGFDVPVLISECIVVKPAVGKVSPAEGKVSPAGGKGLPAEEMVSPSGEGDRPEETPEGERITACLAWLPLDVKRLSSTAYECYFVNDSNYCLFFTCMSREGDLLRVRCSGTVEPNTRIFLEEVGKSDLDAIENITVQFIPFKRHKPFSMKSPCSVDLHLDAVKFFKLHSFRENDYFDEDALICFIMRNDVPEGELRIDADDLSRAMGAKRVTDTRPRNVRTEKAGKVPGAVTEVDLHIGELLDSTAGMESADILEYQLDKFREVMDAHRHRRGDRIIFIHGKGDGILRKAIIEKLKKNYPKCLYQDASFREYGYGATLVTVK
ncbi:MAG: DUF2027 domain-containing protein [Proteiniphilum sp.]|jgi:hypothetical protein|nr:DUF2027 domain-containing protein [Proteiniphilum sp.]